MLGFGILDYLKIGAGALMGALVAGAIAYTVGHWRGVDEGKALAEAAAVQHSLEVIKERNDTNAKVNDLDDAGLCAALGGRWMPGNNVCE